MKKKFIFTTIVAIAITGCSSTITLDQYDATKHAKIRIFGKPNVLGIIHSNIDCKNNPDGSKLEVGGMKDSILSTRQKSMKMPETEGTKNPRGDTYYQEFIVEANKPINIEPYIQAFDRSSLTAFQGPKMRNACDASKPEILKKAWRALGLPESVINTPESQRSFIPKAGHNYEYYPHIQDCGITLIDITATPYNQVTLSPKYMCK
ncbi:hypothetical protein NYR68_09780 [Actinobacillus equuli subsp. haemolyticus]|uniref:hypothetical protein n=1 Tax=Actinobacillus equuli TaxID=718 RepID=UPI0024467154|nr:hypothetical protein [Actinobacillus equuli]WGE50542.1 hypothetical protein NYR68_09780 [Actinobacillus equuli subsp. haemolyticus]